ncbi:MAG: hypothetical protein C0594_00310, partial [Marinilabiliales bacterium]
ASSYGTLPSGDYASYESLNALVGCPLNGNWTITVTDNWSQDDGFIFSWGLNFNPNLYPTQWTYTPGFTSSNQYWIGDDIVAPNGPTVNIAPTQDGTHDYIFSATDDYGCEYDTTLSIVVFEPPTATQPVLTCSADFLTYDVEFDISGGTGPYSVVDAVTGMPVGSVDQATGHFFVTLDSSNPFHFLVYNETDCTPYEVTGNINCGCGTYVGTVVMDPVTVCEGSCITITHNGDQIEAGGDIFEYIIHDGSGSFPYSPIAYSNDPTFCDSDIPGIAYGQTYYIAAHIGEENTSTGHVNLNDTCYSQSMGVPVVWMANPNAIIPLAQDEICGKTIDLNAMEVNSGIGTWTCPECDDAGVVYITSNGTTPNDNNITLTSSDFGTYTFYWTIYNGDCVDQDSIHVTFLDKPSAYAGPDKKVCGNMADLEAIFSISTEGEWSGTGVFFEDNTDPNTQVTADHFGAHTITWTETNSTCTDADEVEIVFVPFGDPDAGLDTVACGVDFTMECTNNVADSIRFGIWSYEMLSCPTCAISFDDINDPQTDVFISGNFGDSTTVMFVWYERNLTSINPICEAYDTVFITFADVPFSNAGDDQDVCGNTVQLSA